MDLVVCVYDVCICAFVWCVCLCAYMIVLQYTSQCIQENAIEMSVTRFRSTRN